MRKISVFHLKNVLKVGEFEYLLFFYINGIKVKAAAVKFMGLEFLDQICQTDDKLINNMLTFEFKQFDHIFNSPAVSRKQSNY